MGMHTQGDVMNAQDLVTKLGVTLKMAERMIASTEPKPEKKKKAYFPGMSTSKSKVDMEIEVMTVCECCGDVQHSVRTIKALSDSPTTMKTATMLCDKCPDYFRALTHEQLVSLALIRHHAGLLYQCPRDSTQVKMAKKLTPEEVVHHKTTHF
jgi:hypothetical protein